MPEYLFENPKTKETKSFFFGMKDEKKVVINGVEWKRVFTVPQASIDTAVDPFSQKDFIKATNKKGTYGDLMDRSAELSAKRKDKAGIDPIRENYFKNYSAERSGLKHPAQIKEEANKRLKKRGVSID